MREVRHISVSIDRPIDYDYQSVVKYCKPEEEWIMPHGTIATPSTEPTTRYDSSFSRKIAPLTRENYLKHLPKRH
jgi:hypothetical protein